MCYNLPYFFSHALDVQGDRIEINLQERLHMLETVIYFCC